MAEVIGVVSGVITFATVFVQITQAVIKLKDFRDQLHDAPQDLKWVVRDLEVFQKVMAGMEAQLSYESNSALLTNYSARQSLDLCKEAADDLSAVSQELFQRLCPSSRFRQSAAAVKVVMKKGSIERQVTRLQNAMRLLSLSQQCYTIALMHEQPKLIANELARVHGEKQDTGPSQDVQVEVPEYVRPSRKRQQATRRPNNASTARWTFRAPLWITATSLEISGLRLSNGWQWNLRTWCEVPSDSEVFTALSDENYELVKDLLLSKKASIYDRTKSGLTLLHSAAMKEDKSLFMFLLNQGADISALIGPITPVHLLVACPVSCWSNQCCDSTTSALRALISCSDDLFFETEEEACDGLLASFTGGSKEQFMFVQAECCPTFFEMSPSARVTVATSLTNLWDSLWWDVHFMGRNNASAQIVRAILQQDIENIHELQRERRLFFLDTQTTFLHEVAKLVGSLVGYRLAEPNSRGSLRTRLSGDELFQEWVSVFCDILMAGANINHTLSGRTLFMEYMCAYLEPEERKSFGLHGSMLRANAEEVNEATKYWVTMIEGLGIDLEIFGHNEAAVWKDTTVVEDVTWRDTAFVKDVIGFTYGKQPQDWHIWIRERSDSYVGDFWSMVERRIEIMPGTWPDQ